MVKLPDMIESFADKNTEKVWNGEPTRKLPTDIQPRARDVLVIVDSLRRSQQLLTLHGLHAHKLSAKGRPHLWSLRINAQWRITFDWDEETHSAHKVQIIDYH